MTTVATALDRAALSDWYRRNRQRSRQLFDIVPPEAYYSRPISLRHPIVFYEGHLPAFSLNTLVKKGSAVLASTSASSACSRAASIPKTRRRQRGRRAEWPSRDEVRRFADECERRSSTRSRTRRLEQPGIRC